jgi:hypothetical protein
MSTFVLKPFDLKSETFLLSAPNKESIKSKVQDAIMRRKIVIMATCQQDFQRLFDMEVSKMEDSERKYYHEKYAEFQAALKEKHGGFEAYMERKHGMSEFNPQTRAIIHYAAYEEGHSAGESEVDNCYYGVIELVRKVIAANS